MMMMMMGIKLRRNDWWPLATICCRLCWSVASPVRAKPSLRNWWCLTSQRHCALAATANVLNVHCRHLGIPTKKFKKIVESLVMSFPWQHQYGFVWKLGLITIVWWLITIFHSKISSWVVYPISPISRQSHIQSFGFQALHDAVRG
jgi:hypothetical protein